MFWSQKTGHCSHHSSSTFIFSSPQLVGLSQRHPPTPPPTGPSPLSGSGDGIYNLYDPVQGRVSANGHVSAAKVVVN